jgi:hypothetical protein
MQRKLQPLFFLIRAVLLWIWSRNFSGRLLYFGPPWHISKHCTRKTWKIYYKNSFLSNGCVHIFYVYLKYECIFVKNLNAEEFFMCVFQCKLKQKCDKWKWKLSRKLQWKKFNSLRRCIEYIIRGGVFSMKVF